MRLPVLGPALLVLPALLLLLLSLVKPLYVDRYVLYGQTGAALYMPTRRDLALAAGPVGSHTLYGTEVPACSPARAGSPYAIRPGRRWTRTRGTCSPRPSRSAGRGACGGVRVTVFVRPGRC